MKKTTQKQQSDHYLKFTLAYTSYKKSLDSYAFFKTNDRFMSDDLVQDAFVKTWLYLVKNGRIDSMRAFLHHVLRHLIVDEYRRRKITSLDTLLEKGFEPSINDQERAVDFLDGEKAILLIQRLPYRYQKVMHMRYVQDLSLKEISLLTGRSKNTIAVQTHRGLEKLKALYNNK